MRTHKTFTASTNKLAYMQTFSRISVPGYADHARGREHLSGHRTTALRSFARQHKVRGRHHIGV